MKKTLLFVLPLILVGCAKYQETGLLCEDATHNSGQAQITLDVKADKHTADIVVNGEKITLKSETQTDSSYIAYYGTNAVGEQVKMNIVFSKNGKQIDYMLGINSDERTYGCFKQQ